VKLIVGLGNPGSRYERTRHNLGFLVVDHCAARNRITFDQVYCGNIIGEGAIAGCALALAKPQVFMNRSGAAVRSLWEKYESSGGDLIIIYDDLDLPFGRIRIRPKGSAGGHRGLASILESLPEVPFQRVRIGIGRPLAMIDSATYVLQPFDPPEEERLPAVLDRAADSIACLVRDGIQSAMAQFNRAS
jgi:PTH1 family peptidyl-tRNA hydrolase